MLVSILLIAIYFAVFGAEGRFLGIINPIYWFETLAIFAFGFSWFVKSEDPEGQRRTADGEVRPSICCSPSLALE
ncbi:MAG: hypothetical protein U0X93_02495 [Anaerolineales bacterium]